jgi:ribosomal protein S18 acetylase RimI-like enzyme
MEANFQIRPVTARDAADLQTACWSNWSIEAITELLHRAEGLARRRRGLGVVAYGESGILGYGQVTLWPRTAEISDLIVIPRSRSQGIGTGIIHYLTEQARSWPVPTVEIGVALSNPRALALYQRLGFAQDRILDLDLGHGAEAVMYLKMPLEKPSA